MESKFLSRDKNAVLINIKTYLCVSVVIAFVTAVLRSVAYITSFDVDPGYFNGSLFPTAVNYLIILSCVFLLSGFVTIPKDVSLPRELDNSGNAVFFAGAFSGFVMLADFSYKIYTMIGEGRFDYYKFIFNPAYRAENAYTTRATAVIEIIGVLASLLAAACFFVRSSKKPNVKLSAWLGFFPTLRALVGVAHIYFDMNVQMNHPSKLMLQFALISVMIYFLGEERFFVSENHPRPRRHFVLGCVALLLSFAAGVSEMVGFFSGNLSRGDFCVEAFFCLIMSFYILVRLVSFVRSADSILLKETEQTEIIEEMPAEADCAPAENNDN